MVRSLDVATQTAIRDRRAVLPRNFVLVWPVSGVEPVFGFTDFGEDISANVVDPKTGSISSFVFYGDNAPILSIDSIPLKIGLEVRTVQVRLNPLHPVVETMARAHNLRNAPVQIHRGWLSPESQLLAAAPRCRLLGQVDGAPIVTAAAGGQSRLTLKIVSGSRELTRTNPARRGPETQSLRDGDQARKYTGTAHLWQSSWGERAS